MLSSIGWSQSNTTGMHPQNPVHMFWTHFRVQNDGNGRSADTIQQVFRYTATSRPRIRSSKVPLRTATSPLSSPIFPDKQLTITLLFNTLRMILKVTLD